MFQYSRLDVMFNRIRINEYTSVNDLESLLGITDRTIRNDIQEINNDLEKNGAIIKLKRNHGYYISILDEDKYNKFVKEMDTKEDNASLLDSSEDRIKSILYSLLSTNEYVTMDDLAESVFISKNTLNKYIKTIKEIIGKYDLEYITKLNAGIKIIGSEDSKRKCIFDNVLYTDFDHYITGFTKEERTIFKDIDLDLLKDITIKQLDEHFVKTSDFNLKNIIIHLALMTTRVLGNNYISIQNINTDASIMGLVNGLCRELEEHYDIAISKGEKNYIYLQIVANTHLEITDIDDDHLRTSILKVLDVIYQDYNFDLRNDEILIADLFRHLKSIFTSKLYDLNSTVSIYIGAAIERCYYKSPKKKNVILVCGSGHATTRMLEARLNVVFPDKINIVKCVSYNEYSNYTKENVKDIDFVITTVVLKSNLLPSIMVDFALNNKDVESINRYLSKLLRKRLQMFDQFFDKDLFFRFNEQLDKETVIKMMCNKLQEKNFVNEDFLQSVLKRETIGKTNMNDVFALPHPMEMCANDTKVAVALLKDPIAWNDSNKIQIVFMLVLKHGEQKDFEHLYDIFIEIINTPKLQQNILKAKTYEEFLDVLYDGIK